MSSINARGDISRAGIIKHSLPLLRVLLECGYYSREGLIWGNTVRKKQFSIFCVFLRDNIVLLQYVLVIFMGNSGRSVSRKDILKLLYEMIKKSSEITQFWGKLYSNREKIFLYPFLLLLLSRRRKVEEQWFRTFILRIGPNWD